MAVVAVVVAVVAGVVAVAVVICTLSSRELYLELKSRLDKMSADKFLSPFSSTRTIIYVERSSGNV